VHSLDSVTVAAPATVANMVCGFDVLGFALAAPYDLVTLTRTPAPGIVIDPTPGYNLPTDPTLNVAGAALHALLQEAHPSLGFRITLDKRIKPGSGIGSSAASAAGVVVAANALLGYPFSKADLVRFAMQGEAVASGTPHADNVAPCIYGGVALVRSAHPLDIVPLAAPELHVALVHPQIEVRTADARAMLRQQVALKTAVQQWGNVAGLVAGLLQADYGLIARSLHDAIVEPVRSMLIPGFDAVKTRSLAAGALGGGISGSGPSLFMLCKDAATAQAVVAEMADVYLKLGLDAHTYCTHIQPAGAWVVA